MDLRWELPEVNTWRLFNKAVSQAAVVAMVEQWEAHGYRFGAVCIDDGWTTNGLLGDWTPDPTRFPDLPGLVEWLHGRGYGVRLWVAPVQIHPATAIFERAFPDHMLKNRQGEPAFYTGLGTYRLDPRSELARQHIRSTMQRLARDYGVDAFKVDFPPFYLPDDGFYRAADYDLPEADRQTMVRDFYGLVRSTLNEVRPGLRVECARDLPGCEPFINDTICGDLVGEPRTLQDLTPIVARLRRYAAGNAMVPWLEMVWGEGGDAPHAGIEWHAGCLEYIALSINFGLKLEHSFLPFDYPNHTQIRALTNLYGPRHQGIKVLRAGRLEFTVDDMLAAGIELNAGTRFLVAPAADVTQVLPTLALRTNALQWKCRNVLENSPVTLRARNEFWGGSPLHCHVAFEAAAGKVYELWCEGGPDPWFQQHFMDRVAPTARPADPR